MAGAIESARRYEQMLELEQLKNDFIGRISHELRTPLTIMAGFVGTLVSTGDLVPREERQMMLERTQAAITRLAGLIDELLTAASFEAGMTDAQLEQVTIAPLLEEVRAHAVDPTRVTISCPPDLREHTDPKLLRQALNLLVDNALKYAGDAEISAEPGVIAVRDHGAGVPAELGERVFDRFVRGTSTGPGMGLGLPLVRSLATALDASVELTAPEGDGACFVLRFGT